MPTELLRIRAALASDREFIGVLGRAAFSEYSPNAAREVTAMADRGRVFVAETGRERLGFVVIEGPKDGSAHVSAIAVEQSARGRGVGKALLLRAEEAARTAGATELGLVTADGNLAALELFLRAGFRRVSRSSRYYARGQPGISLVKAL